MGWWVSIIDLVNLRPPVTFLFKRCVVPSLCLFRYLLIWKTDLLSLLMVEVWIQFQVKKWEDPLISHWPKLMRQKLSYSLCVYGNVHVSLSLWIFLDICRNAGGWIHGSMPESHQKSSHSSCVNWTVSWDRGLFSFSCSVLKCGGCKVIGKQVQNGNSLEGIHIFLCSFCCCRGVCGLFFFVVVFLSFPPIHSLPLGKSVLQI